MVLDKGPGLNHVRDLMQAAPYIDIVKLGWSTPCLFSESDLRQKIAEYKRHAIRVCNGGTLLEIVFQQKRLERFFAYSQELGFEIIEVSNGILPISAAEKAEIIQAAQSRGFVVISEVGKKDPAEDKKLTVQDRIAEARSDLAAGAHLVIIEAREGGKSLGVYDDSGGLKEDMAKMLVDSIGAERIMFEAPEKSQQARLIILFGNEINLGNIRPEDVISLETLRLGMRGDTCGKL